MATLDFAIARPALFMIVGTFKDKGYSLYTVGFDPLGADG